MSESSIQIKTMRRVMLVYYLRKALNPIVLKSGIFFAGMVSFFSMVHVAEVFANMPAFSDVIGVSLFSYRAFVNTHFIVQAVTVTLFVTLFWLIKDAMWAVSLRMPRLYSHA